MTDRLTAFTRAVLRFAPESSMEDAVDSLWLALQLERVHEQTSVPQVDGAESVASGTSLPAAAPEPLADTPVPPSSAPEHPSGVAAPPARKPDPIGPGLLELPSAAKDAKSGLPFRTPTAAALPGKRDILQALRPLMRRVSSSRLRELDLQATLHQFSTEGILYPIERPSLERWFRLVVIIEDSQSMNLWREPIRELYALLSSCGAFCSVRGYQMSASPSLGFLPLGAAQGRRGAARLSALPGLVDPQGRTLLLWVSDCVSSAWADGTIASLLRGIENLGPQLVVQMLPEHLFERTALGAAVPVWLRQLVPGANNRQQEAEPQELFRGLEVEEGACVHIPVATLTPSSLRSWARMVTAAAGAWAPGYGLRLPQSSSGENVDVSSAISTEADSPAFDAEERVRRFRMSASPTARRLARLLSTFSRLSLPLLRLVRGALLQKARQHHEVEVVLSGLLEVLPGKEGTPAEPECAQYGFYPGVREALHELPLTPGYDPPPGDEEVLRAVSKYVTEHDGTTRGFMAVVSSLSALTQGSAKFAVLGEELMRELRKRYSRLAPETARQLIEWSTPTAAGGGSGGGAGSLLPKLLEATQAAPMSQYVGVPRAAKRDQLVGQQNVVEEIRAKLQSGQRAYIGQAVVISGAGGLGKTQLAVEYVDRYGATYPGGVIWLQADGQLDMQLLVLAQDAGWFPADTDPKLLLDLARQRLRSRPDCLLVFDNIEQLQDIQPYLPPPTASTHILATSRNIQEAFTPIELKLLTPELALKLLIQEAGRSPQGPAEQQAAQDIADRLAGLPMALELAGRRLRHRFGLKFSDYRRLLEEQGLEALPKVLAGPTATQSIDIRAVLQVSEQVLAESPLLRRVLNVLTYSGASAVGQSLLAALLGVSEVALSAPLELGDTLKLLELEPSSRPGEPSRPRIHRLVSEARRHYVKPDDLDGGPEALCDRLADWFASRRDDFAQLPAFEAELEALRTWQRYATEKKLLQQLRLLWLQAYPHYHHGQYAQATEWLTQALASTAAYPDLPQTQLADLHDDFGSCWDAEGKYDKALTHKLEALKIRQQCLDPAHPDVATSLDNIGPIYFAQGKYAEALDFQQKALELRKQSPGEAHPDVATSMNNIGTTYRAQGKYAEALDFQQKALELRKQSLGEAHPDVATSMNNIGTTYFEQGKYAEALDFQQKALELRKQSLGEAHPYVANSMYNIGGTYFAQGKFAESLKNQKEALLLLRRSLGEDHPNTGHARFNIGRTYLKLNDARQGWKELQQGVKILKAGLGVGHPDTIASVKGLVVLGRQHGGSLIAQQILAEILAELPPEHPQRAELEALQVGRPGVALQRPGAPQRAASKSAAGAAKARKKKR